MTQPIGAAVQRTKLILFSPFDLGKWFVMGFCAWLAFLGEGGGGGNFNFNLTRRVGPTGPGGGTGGMGGTIRPAVDWIEANWHLVLALSIAGMVLAVALSAVLTWLSSRGRFMLLDGIVHNRAAVSEPWRRFRDLGNSLFAFSFTLNMIGLASFVVVAATGLVVAWPDIRADRFDASATAAVILAAVAMPPLALAFMVVNVLLKDFVVPAMYVFRVPVMKAWSITRREILARHGGTIVLYFLMKFVLALGMGLLAVVATVCSCCLAMLPYFGTVILLPLFVFQVCYPLYFLEQYGERWRFFWPPGWPTYCRYCGYDLTGNESGVCPECGHAIPDEQFRILRRPGSPVAGSPPRERPGPPFESPPPLM